MICKSAQWSVKAESEAMFLIIIPRDQCYKVNIESVSTQTNMSVEITGAERCALPRYICLPVIAYDF